MATITKNGMKIILRRNSSVSTIGAAREKFGMKRKKEFLAALYEKFHISEACRKVGISRNTFEYHIEKDPEFKRAFEEVKNYWLDGCESTILTLGADVENGKLAVTPAIFALKTHRKEWREKQETEVNVNIEVNYTDDIRRVLQTTAVDVDYEEVEGKTVTSMSQLQPGEKEEEKNERK